ncbi:hypothetical protein ACFZC3_28745 [Streptomyces sp. NPDC007903]|uniref:hypothetical protein n=1 Tax=Streptomyces sp. NPDC007903 TaxID=3364786 RepID=UPI0036E790A9
MPSAARLGGGGAGHPRPLRRVIVEYRMVLRHMQSVIAGCKAVLPVRFSAETS